MLAKQYATACPGLGAIPTHQQARTAPNSNDAHSPACCNWTLAHKPLIRMTKQRRCHYDAHQHSWTCCAWLFTASDTHRLYKLQTIADMQYHAFKGPKDSSKLRNVSTVTDECPRQEEGFLLVSPQWWDESTLMVLSFNHCGLTSEDACSHSSSF